MSPRLALKTLREALPLVLARCISGKPDIVLRFDGGIGDDLICTAIVHELRKRGTRKIWMLTDYPELFRNNPDVTYAGPKSRRGVRRFFEVFGNPPVTLNYAPVVDGRALLPERHVISVLCRDLKLTGAVSRRPYLYLTREEIKQGAIGTRQITIQSSGLSAKYAARTKEWFPNRFQELVDHYRHEYTVVQIGSVKDPALTGVVDLRGKTSIRESAAILRNSAVFVGLAGFLQHLARSVDCRAVIVYGGRELPSQTGYTCHGNVTDTPPCSPCWLTQMCVHNVKCMDAIDVATVKRAVDAQLSEANRPLIADCEVC